MLGRIPSKERDSKFIFVAVDHLNKWAETRVFEQGSRFNLEKHSGTHYSEAWEARKNPNR